MTEEVMDPGLLIAIVDPEEWINWECEDVSSASTVAQI